MDANPDDSRPALIGAVQVLALLLTAPATAGPDPYALEWQQLRPGVHVGIRPDSPRIPVSGTAVIVAGRDGVLLFDAGGFANQAEQVLTKVSALGHGPVTHVAISHWHGDHHLGIHRILDRFPKAEVIAHDFTAKALNSRLMDYIKEPQENGMAATRLALEGMLESGKDPQGQPLPNFMRDYYRDALTHMDTHDREARGMKITMPTRTFEDRLVIDLGGRSVELRHLGQGNTKGDIVLWLPEERIVASADLVVRPTPYGFHSEPRPWAATLRRLKNLDATLIVPGHGKPLRDTNYIDLLIETLESVATQVEALAAKGLSLDEVREKVDWSKLEPRFAGGDGFLANRFKVWFKTPIVQGAYNAATGVENESLLPASE